MKLFNEQSVFYSICLILSVFITSCFKSHPNEINASQGMFSGVVQNISYAGGVPENWTPPRYLKKCTIVLLDNNRKHLKEFSTNDEGVFQFFVDPGTYYLVVKESPVQDETGPCIVQSGQILNVLAKYDIGLK